MRLSTTVLCVNDLLLDPPGKAPIQLIELLTRHLSNTLVQLIELLTRHLSLAKKFLGLRFITLTTSNLTIS